MSEINPCPACGALPCDQCEDPQAYLAALRSELSAAIGYLTNAKIDLETDCTKSTAIKTLEGGIARFRKALAA